MPIKKIPFRLERGFFYKKVVLDDFSIDDIANFLQEKYPDADFNSANLKGEMVLQNINLPTTTIALLPLKIYISR